MCCDPDATRRRLIFPFEDRSAITELFGGVRSLALSYDLTGHLEIAGEEVTVEAEGDGDNLCRFEGELIEKLRGLGVEVGSFRKSSPPLRGGAGFTLREE